MNNLILVKYLLVLIVTFGFSGCTATQTAVTDPNDNITRQYNDGLKNGAYQAQENQTEGTTEKCDCEDDTISETAEVVGEVATAVVTGTALVATAAALLFLEIITSFP